MTKCWNNDNFISQFGFLCCHIQCSVIHAVIGFTVIVLRYKSKVHRTLVTQKRTEWWR